MPERIQRLLAHPRLPVAAVLLGTLLALPSLWAPLGIDDYFHRVYLLGDEEADNIYLDLFCFVTGPEGNYEELKEIGLVPWWIHPELKLAFLRPVTIATHVLDYQLWPDNFPLQHLHSLVWYALAVWVVSLLYRRVSVVPAAAGLAALLFAAEDAHALPACWLANRNSLVALTISGLAMLAFIRWRTCRRPVWLVVSVSVYAVALFAAEAALGMLAYLVAYQLTLDRGRLSRRIGALAPYLALIVVWRAVYSSMGYGATGSGLYVDPLVSPVAFIAAVVERMPVLMWAQWTQLPTEVWMMVPRAGQLGWSAAGMAVCAGMLALFHRQLREEPQARFWGLGMVLALVPVCAAFPADRLTLFAGIGAFGLLAGQASRLGWLGGEARGEHGRISRLATGILLVLHGLVALVAFPLGVTKMMAIADTGTHVMEQLPNDAQLEEQSLVFINGNELLVAYVIPVREMTGGAVPRYTSQLASMQDVNRVTRVDENSLEIRPDLGFLAQGGDLLMHDTKLPFVVGQRIRWPAFDATILEITPDGRPANVRFQFDVPLEDPSLRWVYWQDGVLQGFPVPAVGETVVVEPSLPTLVFGDTVLYPR